MAYSCDDLLSLGPAGGMFGMPVAMTPPAFGGRSLNYSVDSLLDFSKLHVEDARCVAIGRYATKSTGFLRPLHHTPCNRNALP
jgi:hypothetical protein